jgi:putative thioredoxin
MEQQHAHIADVTTESFGQDVLQRSREVPVIVDFWAEWCGPCKVLGPILERVTADAAGEFILAKVDVDQNQELAAQFQIQTIPTVMAFVGGVPVGQFSAALPEQQVRAWIADMLPTELDRTVDEARGAALAGDVERAERLFRAVLEEVPDHPDAATGLAAMMIARGETQDALIILGKLPPGDEVDRLQAAARLSDAAGNDINALTVALDANPKDDEGRLTLAQALAARGEYEPALDHMLKVVRSKGPHTDDARRAMLDVFGIIGNEHPLTASYRRQLASALF